MLTCLLEQAYVKDRPTFVKNVRTFERAVLQATCDLPACSQAQESVKKVRPTVVASCNLPGTETYSTFTQYAMST